MVKLKVFGR